MTEEDSPLENGKLVMLYSGDTSIEEAEALFKERFKYFPRYVWLDKMGVLAGPVEKKDEDI